MNFVFLFSTFLVPIFGKTVDITEYPYMVLLSEGLEPAYKDPIIMCAGSLLTGDWILAPAHCLNVDHATAAEPYSTKETPYYVSVSKNIKHPDYNDFTHHNDIGVVKVKFLA